MNAAGFFSHQFSSFSPFHYILVRHQLLFERSLPLHSVTVVPQKSFSSLSLMKHLCCHGEDWKILTESGVMALTQEKLERTRGWGPKQGPTWNSSKQTIGWNKRRWNWNRTKLFSVSQHVSGVSSVSRYVCTGSDKTAICCVARTPCCC